MSTSGVNKVSTWGAQNKAMNRGHAIKSHVAILLAQQNPIKHLCVFSTTCRTQIETCQVAGGHSINSHFLMGFISPSLLFFLLLSMLLFFLLLFCLFLWLFLFFFTFLLFPFFLNIILLIVIIIQLFLLFLLFPFLCLIIIINCKSLVSCYFYSSPFSSSLSCCLVCLFWPYSTTPWKPRNTIEQHKSQQKQEHTFNNSKNKSNP